MYASKEEAIKPNWSNASRVHDWRNYINEELRAIWHTFADEQKIAIMNNADSLASREDWD